MNELEGLVTKMIDGDRTAYEALLDRFQPPVFRLAQRITGSREDAWDVVQEVFCDVHRKREELREPAYFKPWLYRMAYCRAIDLLRARGKAGDSSVEQEIAACPSPGETPHAAAESAAFAGEVGRALSALPEKFREPLLLSTHAALSYNDIAQEVGCPVGTVRSRIATARELLRERLSAWLRPN